MELAAAGEELAVGAYWLGLYLIFDVKVSLWVDLFGMEIQRARALSFCYLGLICFSYNIPRSHSLQASVLSRRNIRRWLK